MRSFKDTKGRSWRLSVTVGLLDDICEELGDDLFNDPTSISLHPRDHVAMLWLAVEDQANLKSIDPRDFGRSLDGETLRTAMDEFMGAMSDFFSALLPGRGEILKQAWETGKALNQIEKVIIGCASGKDSIDSEELQELILALSPFGNLENLPTEEIQNLKERLRQALDGELDPEEIDSLFHSKQKT